MLISFFSFHSPADRQIMFDFQQQLPRKHHYSFNPVYQTPNSHEGTKSIDFDFWDAEKNRAESAGTNGDSFEAYSPPLWIRNTSRSTRTDVYPSLPAPTQHRHYTNLSPKSRAQAIAKGREEIMRMIQNMPESSYELSLRDIVDQEIMHEEAEEEIVVAEEETGFDFKTGVKIQQKKKKKKQGSISRSGSMDNETKKKSIITTRGQISRSGSMDNETFLLKMFFPTSIITTHKKSIESRSKVSQKSPFDEDKEWWKKKNLVADENKTSGGTSSINRYADSISSMGCWSFFHTKKNKTRRQGMSLFNGLQQLC